MVPVLMAAGPRRFVVPLLLVLAGAVESSATFAADPKDRPKEHPKDRTSRRDKPVEDSADEPIVDDLDRARTLRPPPGGLAGVLEDKEPEGPKVAREVAMVTVHGRYITVPGFMFDVFFKDYGVLANESFGASYEWGDLDSAMWAIELDWSNLVIDAGNWLEHETPPAGATYAEPGLSMISIDAMYRRQIPFTDSFRGLVGGGLGLGILIGNVKTAEVLPTCTEPIDQCPHWPNVTNENAELPTRVVPIVHVSLGLELDVGAGFALRLQGGFRDAFYGGLTIGKQL